MNRKSERQKINLQRILIFKVYFGRWIANRGVPESRTVDVVDTIETCYLFQKGSINDVV